MILYILCISVVLFVIFIFSSGSKAFSKHKWLQYVLVTLSLLLFLGSEGLLVLNEHSHFGMKTKVYTKNLEIYSATGQKSQQPVAPFLVLTQNVGKDKLYLYNISTQGKPRMKHTQITDHNLVKNTDQPAYLAIEKTRRVFKNDFYKTLFAYSGNKNVLVSTRNVFYLPQNHQVMSVQDMKKMQKEMQKKQAMQQKK